MCQLVLHKTSVALMGIMKRLPDIALLRRLPVCSCFSRRSPQGSPVDMGCSADDKTQVTGVNIVQVRATDVQCFAQGLYDLLC